MEYKGINSQPNNRVSQPQQQPQRAAEGSSLHMSPERDGKKTGIIIAIIVVALIIIGGLGWWFTNSSGANAGVKKGQYQAIFLTNGQVYFCKLAAVTDQYVDCTDIYYLQVQQASTVQPADNKTNNQSPQVSLAKLGSELHGPEDEMHINRDQVLFWENLKDGGKVVQAIKQNQQQK